MVSGNQRETKAYAMKAPIPRMTCIHRHDAYLETAPPIRGAIAGPISIIYVEHRWKSEMYLQAVDFHLGELMLTDE